jgi:hypothetical protein
MDTKLVGSCPRQFEHLDGKLFFISDCVANSDVSYA